MEKYFIPDKEDLRVGYLCERKTNSGWKPCNMDYYDLQIFLIEGRSDWYRTPYLAKEQIPAEDWDTIKEEDGEGAFSGIKETRGFVYTFLWTTDLILSVHEDERCLFFGECKDINTYRLICKLINI